MTRLLIKLIITFSILGFLGFLCFNIYSSYFMPYNQSPTGKVILTVEEGDNMLDLAQKLTDKNAIKDPNSLVLLNQVNPVGVLQVGDYQIQLPAAPNEILGQIRIQTKEIGSKMAKEIPRGNGVKVTFTEGQTLDEVIDKLVEKKLGDRKSFEIAATNPSKELQNRYPFLPPTLNCTYGTKDCVKYYLEGYLYPDTYEFFEGSTPNEIFGKMLANFQRKVWGQLPRKVTTDEFYKYLTMASVIEKETGRPITGVNASNIDALKGERRNVASVFYNRLAKNESWKSDPTVVYGTGRRVCQQTVKVENCVNLDSPQAANKYNTYNNAGYPIGPITSPQLDTVLAAMEPSKTDYFYFVSDGIGNKYFAVTDVEHFANITKVQKINSERVKS
jgi:UPF0755 protein